MTLKKRAANTQDALRIAALLALGRLRHVIEFTEAQLRYAKRTLYMHKKALKMTLKETC
jgi:hypothetical protein